MSTETDRIKTIQIRVEEEATPSFLSSQMATCYYVLTIW
jgi:hypothetical protein